MSEDAKPSERRRRITRAGRRRRPAREETESENWRSTTDGTDTPEREPPDTLRDTDGLYAADLDAEFEDDELDEYEALGELDATQRDVPSPHGAGGDASPLVARPSLPLVREPRGDAFGGQRKATIDEALVFDADDPELEDDAPTFPQMRRPDFANDRPRDPAAPVVVVARATIVGNELPSKPVGPPSDGGRIQSPPPPARVSVPPPPPPADPEDGALQLVDVEDAVFDSGRPPPTRSPPPPPPPDPKYRSAASSSAQASARKPPPPPGPQPRVEERSKARKPRQWWERFFSEDYLMTVLPPTTAQVAKQVDFIEASIGVSKGGTILDVGCGLGLHAIELTRRGYLVVALDLSLAMITHASEAAQQQKLRLSFVHADIREMEFDGAFDAAICMGTTFGFFDDEANKDVLTRLFQALRPGGRVLLDVVNRDYVTRFQPNLVWFEGDSCVCMEESDFNYFNARLSVKRTMMREDGHQTNAEYSLRLYSLHELGTLLQQTGFRVLEVSGQEAIRGVFFGGNAPRILMLAERRAGGSPSRAMPPERHSGEIARPTSGIPGERTSAEFTKSARGGTSES